MLKSIHISTLILLASSSSYTHQFELAEDLLLLITSCDVSRHFDTFKWYLWVIHHFNEDVISFTHFARLNWPDGHYDWDKSARWWKISFNPETNKRRILLKKCSITFLHLRFAKYFEELIYTFPRTFLNISKFYFLTNVKWNFCPFYFSKWNYSRSSNKLEQNGDSASYVKKYILKNKRRSFRTYAVSKRGKGGARSNEVGRANGEN